MFFGIFKIFDVLNIIEFPTGKWFLSIVSDVKWFWLSLNRFTNIAFLICVLDFIFLTFLGWLLELLLLWFDVPLFGIFVNLFFHRFGLFFLNFGFFIIYYLWGVIFIIYHLWGVILLELKDFTFWYFWWGLWASRLVLWI